MEDTTPKPNETKRPVALREEAILAFWKEKGIFEKSLGEQAPLDGAKGDYVFYDGPPFATGLPHFGHVLPTSIKDAIPRYKTMNGFRVRRRWGWDCHGLPIENLVEKELNLKAKKDILDYGIGRFNEAARATVLRYEHDWRKIIPRLGRWVDMDNDYKTMDSSYTESVWWAFKNLHDKGLIYEGFKSMQLCPRCETTLSNFEVNQGYKDITDISVYVMFELVGEPETRMLAWTTTPWTLPGNAALAVNPEVEYVKIKMSGDAHPYSLILAKERLSVIKTDHTVVATMKGSELVGRSYKPVFSYYSKDQALKNHKNGWKIYAADFVTTTDGTGVVHIAPAFGPDDMELGRVHNLPFLQHVSTNGQFKKEITDVALQFVKPKDGTLTDKEGKPDKDAHQRGDIEIIKLLAAKGSLFAKEKIVHSYAHCWRCDTPLLNYASSSWFVKVPDIKDKLVAENSKVNWVPEEVGHGRFGNWLAGARDWAISRSRFWGAPLPVWKIAGEENGMIVMSSVEDLKRHSHAKNTYFVMRHGEAENNTKCVISSTAERPHHLTTTGKSQVEEAAAWLKDKKIDIVYVSPFVRTRETAAIVAKHLNLQNNKIHTDPAIGELNAGDYDGMDFRKFIEQFPFDKRFEVRPPNGENYLDIKRRMGDFLYSLEKKHEGKRILIVTHDSPAFLLSAAAKGLDKKATTALRGVGDHFMKNASPFELDFTPLPHNEDYELDLHRPYIDDVELSTMVNGKQRPLVRVPEVFDCWFESGSMPYAEAHYPFATDGEFKPIGGLFKKTKGYPADFIAEGQDQTRGWFYSMLVLGVALFGRSPYKNVIVNGIVLAEDGQKLSKKKQNYPDLMLTVNKFGADALRFYLLSSPLVRAQEFAFSERGVDEVAKKHIGRLSNVVSFYEMYADKIVVDKQGNIPTKMTTLDRWIRVRLMELTGEVTSGFEAYELDRAARPFADFIDDLSTWYVRRSRDRFKNDDADTQAALATLRYVLIELAKLLAPFMPFLAEDIYLRVAKGMKESVHLEVWPQASALSKDDTQLLAHMKETRRIVSLGLEARMNTKINVRQPLSKLTVTSTLEQGEFYQELIELIKDEVNVKEIVVAATGTSVAELDTTMTPELKEEGNYREIIRAVQDLRKVNGLSVSDIVTLDVSGNAIGLDIITKRKADIMKVTGLKDIISRALPTDVDAVNVTHLGDMDFVFTIKK